MEGFADRARALAGQARTLAPETESGRRLPAPLVEAISAAGLFRMLVPAELGGGEADPAELVDAVAALGEGDGSAGWCLAVGATSGMLGAYLPREAGAEIFGSDSSIAGGVFAPRGMAEVAAPVGATTGANGESSRVSGRWPFASGCEHCDWLMGGTMVRDGGSDGGEIRRLESGGPDIRLMLFPASEVEIHDTWDVAGLRGTGSHDFSVDAAQVPAERSASLISDKPRVESTLYAFPVFGLLAVAISAVGLGIARGAISELIELASAKKPGGSSRTLAQRPDTQSRLAVAEAKLRSARALIDQAVGDATDRARESGEVTVESRAELRLAASHAVHSSRDVVDAMYELGGGSAIYASSPLQRRMRDVHVATQHMLFAPSTWELAGRILLGEPTDTSQL